MRLLYVLYSLLFYLALPILFIRLYWKSRRLPAYQYHWRERLGYYSFTLNNCIWVHAVSLGESIAAITLIKALQKIYPAIPILVTNITPTGRDKIKTILGDSVFYAYLPYDLPAAMTRFLSSMTPQIAIIMERELWPNLLASCQAKYIPVCLVNARLSKQSCIAYQRILPIARAMLHQIMHIAAQSDNDAARFLSLGAKDNQVSVTGSIKFDLISPPAMFAESEKLRILLGKQRFVWIAASTHEGEESIILETHKQLRERYPTALLILAPRHPDRFAAVAKMCKRFFVTQPHSQAKDTLLPDTAVYLGDTVGELLLFYGAADVAFVGGSLVNIGGHNLLEPALLSKPILTGSFLRNFAEISILFTSSQAMFIINKDTLLEKIIKLAGDPQLRHFMGTQAHALIKKNQGATHKIINIIQHIIK